ncbi:recombinase RecT [Polynucleobacter sp. MWH-CaK5]|uniref:recombinase RecT n=1 Tax=Polynucleobacter sp. MWH-CaK5 TaxID=2689107 RepID=UPI001BFD011B|nr:recombinase RecT [Polynucleobacter sp. MWH-CaK5]QWD89147.1 recombinase RecT [Polynucleobacter sp. MWH-CaK5]
MKALQQSINTLCQTMALDPEEIQLWLDQHLGLPLYPQVQLLRLANKYQLDPLSDEISLLQGPDQSYQTFITIDGWSKLINHHPQYAGMSLRDSTELIDGIPSWMECTIYRNDRILPIVIKEYFEEVRTDHPSWQQMPRRMLRHRVIQQCARLAFNISSSERYQNSLNKENIMNMTPINSTSKNQVMALKEKLLDL